MTDQRGAPGAAAVILYHEEITDDDKGTISFYNRIKILRQDGLKAATIKLLTTQPASGYGEEVQSFAGRTIHGDGTIVPMSDPPQDETIRAQNEKVIEKTYKLPQPDVGSILEYRYTFQLQNHLQRPTWTLSGNTTFASPTSNGTILKCGFMSSWTGSAGQLTPRTSETTLRQAT